MTAPGLSRAGLGLEPRGPQRRIVHLGVGSFHRAHQAWYTQHADPDRAWSIVAFTGRSSALADGLADQDGLYTLVERGPDGDAFEVIDAIEAVHDGRDVDAFTAAVADPSTAVLTITVTERAYLLRPGGGADLDSAELRADVAALTHGGTAPTTVPGRVVAALEARRQSNAGGLAVMSCDNIPQNGTLLRRAITDVAAAVSPDLLGWIESQVTFPNSSVDRITPATTAEDIATVARECGWSDSFPVVTEPYRSWVISGEFPAGRPLWEDSGVIFAADIEPWERRKLWLLNGAHSILAYAGLNRGHSFVHEAVIDAECLAAVKAFWAECTTNLPPFLDPGRYCQELLERFRNPRIAHRLEQIAADGAVKLAIRIGPTLALERTAGRSAAACADSVAEWIRYVSTMSRPVEQGLDVAMELGSLAPREQTRAAIELIAPGFERDSALIDLVLKSLDRRTWKEPAR